jgi:hypothetical protein
VPPKGQRVTLRNNANLSTGGAATDVTDDVHPEVAARAIAAAHMVGLDICGVDLVCDSVLKPIEEQNGGIVEVNAAPGLRMHISPSFGKGRAVGEAIMDTLYAPGDDGRIPVVAVTGTNGKTTTVRLIAHLLASSGLRTGMTNTDGVYIQGRRIDSGDCSGPRSARNVLMHPDVDAAVFETARGGMLREGLAFDRCQVAVVTNIGAGDHLGLNYITTLEDLAVLKRVIVQNVAPGGMAVLNAADPIVAAMAENTRGDVTYFALDASLPVMQKHRAQGRRIVYVDGATWSPCRASGTARAAGRGADHPRRRDRLPGRERDGVRGRGLGGRHLVGCDPPRPEDLRGRERQRAGPLQRVRLPRRHRDRRLRPQPGRDPGAGERRRIDAGQAPLGGDLRRGRPPRRGHPRADPHPRQGVRRRAAVRRPVPARPLRKAKSSRCCARA